MKLIPITLTLNLPLDRWDLSNKTCSHNSRKMISLRTLLTNMMRRSDTNCTNFCFKLISIIFLQYELFELALESDYL